jgi:hypothetical protein
LCHLGIQHPRKRDALNATHDYYYLIDHGPQANCPDLFEEVKGMKEGQGNYHFCQESKLAKKVMGEEALNVLDPHETLLFHKYRCGEWLRNHKDEFKNVKTAWDITW